MERAKGVSSGWKHMRIMALFIDGGLLTAEADSKLNVSGQAPSVPQPPFSLPSALRAKSVGVAIPWSAAANFRTGQSGTAAKAEGHGGLHRR